MGGNCGMKNVPALLYALAAAIWLVLGIMSVNAIYIGLAVVFFVLAFKQRKSNKEKSDE
jgi:hypothetical protein